MQNNSYLEGSGNKGWCHPFDIKKDAWETGIKIWLQSKVEAWEYFSAEQTWKPSWFIAYVM